MSSRLLTFLVHLLLFLNCFDAKIIRYTEKSIVFNENVSSLFGNDTEATFIRRVESLAVVDIQIGCGRMKNRIVVFSDGSRACCKYSENKKERQGELYSYHLSKILNIPNVPPAVVVTLNLSGPQWRGVSDKVRKAGWRNGSKMLMTLFVEDLGQEYFPSIFKNFTDKNQLYRSNDGDLAAKQRLYQWSNMIIFDYLTGNSDRLFCSLVNMQWAPSVLHNPIHNLGRTRSGSLVLYDNESAFAIGYNAFQKYSQKIKFLHVYFVEKLCFFNHHVMETLSEHVGKRDLLIETELRLQSYDKLGFTDVGQLSQKSHQEFMKRTKKVLDQFNNCFLQMS